MVAKSLKIAIALINIAKETIFCYCSKSWHLIEVNLQVVSAEFSIAGKAVLTYCTYGKCTQPVLELKTWPRRTPTHAVTYYWNKMS
jgi:hypothetical protein